MTEISVIELWCFYGPGWTPRKIPKELWYSCFFVQLCILYIFSGNLSPKFVISLAVKGVKVSARRMYNFKLRLLEGKVLRKGLWWVGRGGPMCIPFLDHEKVKIQCRWCNPALAQGFIISWYTEHAQKRWFCDMCWSFSCRMLYIRDRSHDITWNWSFFYLTLT